PNIGALSVRRRRCVCPCSCSNVEDRCPGLATIESFRCPAQPGLESLIGCCDSIYVWLCGACSRFIPSPLKQSQQQDRGNTDDTQEYHQGDDPGRDDWADP